MGGPLKKVSELMEWNGKPRKKTLFFFAGVSGMESTSEAPSSAHRCAASPFFSSTFVGPLRAIKKLSEKKWKGLSFSLSLLVQ